MNLAPYVDHTLLEATATTADISSLCTDARAQSFKAVCFNPQNVVLCARELEGSRVLIATVCGFPIRATTSAQKADEARSSVQAGADEIDMVIAIGSARAGDWNYVQADVAAVRQATAGKVLKVIIETCHLTDEQKEKAAEAAVLAGTDFVETSTGFGTGGATLADVPLMKRVIAAPAEIMASASAGERPPPAALISAGAARLGTSGGVGLVAGTQSKFGYCTVADFPPALPELILASGSPRRHELLTHLGVPFRAVTSDIPEVSVHTGPAEVARDLAEQKARAVQALLPGTNALILASDTLVALPEPEQQGSEQPGTILGKPTTTEQNAEYLRQLPGQPHRVYSGVALPDPAGMHSGVEMTEVRVRTLSESEITHDAASGEGLDKAWGYGIQGLGMALVARIAGDYSSVVGFPLALVISLLRGSGLPVWGHAHPAAPTTGAGQA